jgi:hypothetical protein
VRGIVALELAVGDLVGFLGVLSLLIEELESTRRPTHLDAVLDVLVRERIDHVDREVRIGASVGYLHHVRVRLPQHRDFLIECGDRRHPRVRLAGVGCLGRQRQMDPQQQVAGAHELDLRVDDGLVRRPVDGGLTRQR